MKDRYTDLLKHQLKHLRDGLRMEGLDDALRIEAETNKWLLEVHTQNVPKKAQKYVLTPNYLRTQKIEPKYYITYKDTNTGELKTRLMSLKDMVK